MKNLLKKFLSWAIIKIGETLVSTLVIIVLGILAIGPENVTKVIVNLKQTIEIVNDIRVVTERNGGLDEFLEKANLWLDRELEKGKGNNMGN